MNLKVISRNVGMALLVSALFMLLSVLISLHDGADSALAPLVISFIITFIVGIFPFFFVRKTSQISLKDGYMIIFLSWLLSFIFGSMPYALWGGPFTVVNAWFESVSGFTTTGATILSDVEALPRSHPLYRRPGCRGVPAADYPYVVSGASAPYQYGAFFALAGRL